MQPRCRFGDEREPGGTLDLRQPTVRITGASSGIGRALALAFHQAGARLILSARREEALDQVRSACEGDPERVAVLPLDLVEPHELAAKAQEALRPYGAIDILVHSAGLGQRSLVQETDLRVDRLLMEVHFLPGLFARAISRYTPT